MNRKERIEMKQSYAGGEVDSKVDDEGLLIWSINPPWNRTVFLRSRDQPLCILGPSCRAFDRETAFPFAFFDDD